jgi:hypothetical protein
VVAVVNIQKVGKVTVTPCLERKAEESRELTLGRTYKPGYSRCGEVGWLKAVVVESLRGDVSGTIEALVANTGPLVLGPCDDRPELPKMAGLQAILYLQREEERWWTIDGPDSIYTHWPQQTLSQEFIARVKRLVSEPITK